MGFQSKKSPLKTQNSLKSHPTSGDFKVPLSAGTRAGAGGYQNYQPGYQKKNLGAKRQKNRSRENAFAEVLPGRPKFGVRSEKIEHSNFVMATSGVLECTVYRMISVGD